MREHRERITESTQKNFLQSLREDNRERISAFISQQQQDADVLYNVTEWVRNADLYYPMAVIQFHPRFRRFMEYSLYAGLSIGRMLEQIDSIDSSLVYGREDSILFSTEELDTVRNEAIAKIIFSYSIHRSSLVKTIMALQESRERHARGEEVSADIFIDMIEASETDEYCEYPAEWVFKIV